VRSTFRSTDEPADADERRWTGAALVRAASSTGAMDLLDARLLSFEVALAVRAEDDRALDALSALISGVATSAASADDTVLTNTLTALQHGARLAAGWAPPVPQTARLVAAGLASGTLLHEQTQHLLEAIVDADLVGSWLGDETGRLAAAVSSTGLRAELQQSL
jgi:hypothetical protein